MMTTPGVRSRNVRSHAPVGVRGSPPSGPFGFSRVSVEDALGGPHPCRADERQHPSDGVTLVNQPWIETDETEMRFTS